MIQMTIMICSPTTTKIIFMASKLMARTWKSPAQPCLLAIAAIKARAGQCTDNEEAGFHCKAYAYIPQWLYFVTLLDKQQSCEQVEKDVDSLITIQCIDDVSAELKTWFQKLHNECLFKKQIHLKVCEDEL